MIPVLYSFRRCPYAMRARLALAASGSDVELREVLLRDKPAAFLNASPSKTVPCLVTTAGVIDESLDIMIWALTQADPDHWLDMPESGWDLIATADGPFKAALDRTKYATRYPDSDWRENRDAASRILSNWNMQIEDWFFDAPTIADFAILPFVRQFAFIDKAWFDAQPWPNLQRWLSRFIASGPFETIMYKLPPWQDGDDAVYQTQTGLAASPGQTAITAQQPH